MRVLYCKDAVVPIDKIASAYIDQTTEAGDRGVRRDVWTINVADVAGFEHGYAVCFDANTAGTQLDNLANWLEAGAPPDEEP